MNRQHASQDSFEDGRNAAAFDIEDDLWRASALNDLAGWIGAAQDFAAHVRMISEIDSSFAEQLKMRGAGAPDFDFHHAKGLQALYLAIGAHMGAIARATGLDNAASSGKD